LIAILDYGSGNLHSAARAFALADSDVRVTADPDIAANADGLVVPGVGAFGACMAQFRSAGAEAIVRNRLDAGKAIFGICVGMQIFFSQGTEKEGGAGLGIWPGSVDLLSAPILPHMGWNTIEANPDSRLFAGVEQSSFYFVHSYAAHAEVPDALNTWGNYDGRFLAAVEKENLVTTQFHPEKSGDAGARLIKNWVATL
jgi:glutamine amidotransferase